MFKGRKPSNQAHFQGQNDVPWLDPNGSAPQAPFELGESQNDLQRLVPESSEALRLPGSVHSTASALFVSSVARAYASTGSNGPSADSGRVSASTNGPYLGPYFDVHSTSHLGNPRGHNLFDRSRTVTSGTVFNDNTWTSFLEDAAPQPPVQTFHPANSTGLDLQYVTTPAGLTSYDSSRSHRDASDDFLDGLDVSHLDEVAQTQVWPASLPQQPEDDFLSTLFPEIYPQGIGTSKPANSLDPFFSSDYPSNNIDPTIGVSASFEYPRSNEHVAPTVSPLALQLPSNEPTFSDPTHFRGFSAPLQAIVSPAAELLLKSNPRKHATKSVKPAFTLQSGIGKFHTGRSRKPFSKDRKVEVALTRARGACFRCKVSRITVRENFCVRHGSSTSLTV